MRPIPENGTLEKRSIFQPLRWTYGVVPILAGLDKFTNQLTDWEKYLHPAIADALPVSAGAAMQAIGVVEILVGALVLSRLTRLGASLAMGWLVLVAGQLAALGLFDVAVRDLAMAVGAYTLARVAGSPARATRPRSMDAAAGVGTGTLPARQPHAEAR